MNDLSHFPPPRRTPPEEPPRRGLGFPGPVPVLEGRAMSALRMAWNFLLSLAIGGGIGAVGTVLAREALTTLFGEPGDTLHLLLRALGWAVGLGATFVLFMSYYLDNSQE